MMRIVTTASRNTGATKNKITIKSSDAITVPEIRTPKNIAPVKFPPKAA